MSSEDKPNDTGNGAGTMIGINRRSALKAAAAAGALVGFGASTPVSAQSTGGPVVLMGIDAEDGGLGGHGDISIYQGVANDILATVTNGNSGILAIGAKSGTHTGAFWNAIESGTGETVTFVNGETSIRDADFGNYAMIGVASSSFETSFGGLTSAENGALNDRSADVAALVNGGGGLLGFSQFGFSNAWQYLGGLGAFSTINNLQYSDVTATSAGNDIGITDTNLDLCCWHDTFTTWPTFLEVLAWRSGYIDVQAAALGGASVVIPTCETKETDLLAGQDINVGTVTATQLAPGDPILVTYRTTGDWYMTETHLLVAEDCDFSDVTTRSGNPRVGHFDHSDSHDPVVQEHTVEVELDGDWEPGDELCIAAHAVVQKIVDDEVLQEETAWGEGDRFTERGNWAMHFSYDLCGEAE